MTSDAAPLISTTVLNWNRSDLLERTLVSYCRTVTVPFELFVVDNGSTDDSQRIIKDLGHRFPKIQPILLPDNRGGEALNEGLARSEGAFLHLSENDIEYLPGWCERALEYFSLFPKLGQLSLFGPVPTDDEVWGVKPCVLRHAGGRILYEAHENVGTTSIIRRSMWDSGLRVQSLSASDSHRMPADMLLSHQIKQAGFFVAWADHYLVRNVGHTEEELRKRVEYYKDNYGSKPWVGPGELEERLKNHADQPKPLRSSILFPDETISPEKSLAHSQCSRPQLWSMLDGWTAEVETLEFLYGLIRLTKPRFAVETGTWHGYAATAIGQAMKHNGFGSLVTLETDSESCRVARDRVHEAGLESIVDVINGSSLTFKPQQTIDFLLADSDLGHRFSEFKHFQSHLAPLAMVIFHDTSAAHGVVLDGVRELQAANLLSGVLLQTPRGLAVCQYTGESRHAEDVAIATKTRHKSTSSVGSVANSTDRNTTVVPILGMHRSGTSMITRALNLMGLDLGGPLQEPLPDNPRGYWENEFFMQTNGELLKAMQADVNGFAAGEELLKLPDLCRRMIVEDSKLAEIRGVIAKTFASTTWGWKDPRTVLTWNVWNRMLSDLGFEDVRPIIIVRHPSSVVRSLVKRAQHDSSIPFPEHRLAAMANEMWIAYNEILWKCCNQNQWFVATYEAFIDPERSKSELQRLARYCGLDEARIAEAMASITTSDKTQLDPHGTTPRALELYERFRQRAEPPSSIVVPADRDERRLLQRAEQFKSEGRIDAAVDVLTKALDIRPQYRAARFQLGYTLMETGHITRSAEHADALITANPDDPVGHGLKAFGLTQQARVDAAIKSFRECIRCLPTNNVAWSNMLFTSLYSDQLDAQDVTGLHIEAGESIAGNGKVEEYSGPENCRTKPLRVGYLSGDFKKHPVGYFMRSLVSHHDSERVETTCYNISPAHDELTKILQKGANHWCDARQLSDDELIQQIRSDDIDVLIDLCGHSSGNRAAVFARRAAPVQALYLGYPSTSGLPNMDYVISDAHISPPEFDDLYSERVLRLKDCFLCFHPYDDAPDVAPLPFDDNGFITFGSFNNLPKISPTTVRLWSQVLNTVNDSRLAMKTLSFQDPGTREHFYQQFAEHGIDRERIDLLPPTVPLSKFLDEYRRIDIGLDSFPYNGGTTTCEALWMGVPVLTFPGEHFYSRMGLSILNTVGLSDLVASSPNEFVQLATALAADTDRLRELRSNMRERLMQSPLCDAESFTRDFESRLVDAFSYITG